MHAETRAAVSALQQDNVAMRQENASMHAETRAAVSALQQDNVAMRQENASARQENAEMHAETRRHFDVTVERMEKRFDLLAESVAHLDEKLDRSVKSLDEKIDHTAYETQAMIKFSHKDLDRRLTSLEDTVADLQARLERLEGSTH